MDECEGRSGQGVGWGGWGIRWAQYSIGGIDRLLMGLMLFGMDKHG